MILTIFRDRPISLMFLHRGSHSNQKTICLVKFRNNSITDSIFRANICVFPYFPDNIFADKDISAHKNNFYKFYAKKETGSESRIYENIYIIRSMVTQKCLHNLTLQRTRFLNAFYTFHSH